MLIGVVIWSLSFTIVHNPHASRETAVLAGNISSIGWLYFCGLLVMFFHAFARKGIRRPPWLIPLVFMPPLIALLFGTVDNVVLSLAGIHAFPPAADESESGGIVCVATDISDYKISEADLRAEVRARTMLLSNTNARLEHEIGQHKKAEERLRSSEARWKIVFEDAPDAYYISDLSGTFVDGNRKVEEITGYTRSELVGKNFLTLRLLGAPDADTLGRPQGIHVPAQRRKRSAHRNSHAPHYA